MDSKLLFYGWMNDIPLSYLIGTLGEKIHWGTMRNNSTNVGILMLCNLDMHNFSMHLIQKRHTDINDSWVLCIKYQHRSLIIVLQLKLH